MVTYLIVLIFAVSLAILLRRIKRGSLAFDHVVGFTLGSLAYWLLPAAIGCFSLFDSDTSAFLGLWRDQFNLIPPAAITRFLIVCLCYLGCFALGSVRFHPLLERKTEREVALHSGPGKWVLSTAVLAFGGLAAYFVFTLRASLFAGYTDDTYSNFGFRGSLTAVVAALFTMFLLDFDSAKKNKVKPGRFAASVVVTFCIALLSIGSRMMVMQCIAAFGVYWTVFRKPCKVWKLTAIALLLLSGSTFVGIWRMGDGASLDEMVGHSAYEYIGTSHSLMAFLATQRFDLTNWPAPLVDDLKNLAPTMVVGEKDIEKTSLELQGYDVYNPFGALNNYLSLMGNFGVAGSCCFLFCSSWLLEYLRRRQTTLARVQYSVICAMLPMSFFRDPFRVSLVKGVIQNGLLIPWMIVGAAALLTVVWQAGESTPALGNTACNAGVAV